MKTKYKILTKYISLFSVLLAFVFSSCTHDDNYGYNPDTATEGELAVTFTVQLPAQTAPSSTYAMDDAAENHLETIDVLAFRLDSDGRERFLYRSKATSINQNNGSNIKQFQATLFKKEYQQRFVILANAREELDALGDIQDTGIKEEVLKLLTFKNENAWDATSNIKFTPFPMWGESGMELVNDAATQISGIKLLRMAARIDVILDSNADGEFKLASVAIYNRKTYGHMVPDTEDPNVWNENEKKVYKATIPSDDGTLNMLGPLRYTSPTTADSAFIQTIYTFEAKAVDMDKSSQATCLVIGGYFENDTKPSYYRLDFTETDRNNNVTGYKDILRNHLYKVNITEISGRGYPTEEEAFNAKSLNMECEVLEWDQGEFGNIVFDGQYLLAVDPGEFLLTREERNDNEIIIFTDYPKGWTATVEEASWLTLLPSDPVTGSADTKSTLLFKVEENTTGATRTTTIKITAGRLTYVVEVTQTTQEALSLVIKDENDVEVTELLFCSKTHLTYEKIDHQLNVKWEPGTSVCLVSASNITGEEPFAYANNTDPMTSGRANLVGGEEMLPLEAMEMNDKEIEANPFMQKIKRLDFTVNNGSSYIMKSVFLRQVNYAVIAAEVLDEYETKGGIGTFKVKSNASWVATIEAGDNNDGMITSLITTQGGANLDGETFRFNLVNNEDLDEPEATITFTSPEGKFDPVKVTVKGASGTTIEPITGMANCYMLIPGGDGISFPVAQANADGVLTRISNGQELTAELLWTDSPYGMSANGAVAKVSVEGTGPTAKLVVVPGKSAGNAVVAVRTGGSTGPIRWSWHIWVVDYNPATGTTYPTNGSGDNTWMDRNLGAISSTPGNSGTVGLLYQWGRKDPFPGAASIGSTSNMKIYTASAQGTNYSSTLVSVAKNLENSIENPMVFYSGTSTNYNDWYTNSGLAASLNSNLWHASGNVKTAYDPCPYGWRLPYEISYKSPWQDYAYETRSWNSGIQFNSIGYWPVTNYIQSGTGTLSSSDGNNGYYWAGTNNGSYNARSMNFKGGTTVDTYSETRRGQGYAVRCVKDK